MKPHASDPLTDDEAYFVANYEQLSNAASRATEYLRKADRAYMAGDYCEACEFLAAASQAMRECEE